MGSKERPVRKLGVFVLIASLSFGSVLACSSGSGNGFSENPQDAGLGEGSTSSSNSKKSGTGSSSKPPPKPKDGGAPHDAAPPPPASKTQPDGGTRDAGRLTDASVDAAPPDAATTSSATPLDPIDEIFMSDEGLAVGACSDIGLSKDTGFCQNDSAGQDFVEGCVDTGVYLLDCARYDTAGSTRASCQDDGVTVGCYLHDVSPIADFEKGDTVDAFDMFHTCPSSWEGTGFCDGNFLHMCSGGEDYVLDCGVFNIDSFTYTCGKDTSGTISCQ
jgi:hypothetical protein